MKAATSQSLVKELIAELAENYSLDETTVIELLCKSLSETLSEKCSYRVETFFKDGDMFFIGRTYQHGKEVDLALSISKLNYEAFQKTKNTLLKKLDIEECRRSYQKYGAYINQIHYGRVERLTAKGLFVVFDNINIPGICELPDIFEGNPSSLLDKTLAFNVKSVSQEIVEKRFRFILKLSRRSPQMAALLIKHLAKDNELIIKSVRRIPGKFSYLRSNKTVKKKILQKAMDELGGEAIRIRPLEGCNGKA